jgi:predicted dehydrogenase
MSAPIGVGVIGLGFMGRTHAAAYRAAAASGLPCELRAVCDHSPERVSGAAIAAGNLATAAGSADLAALAHFTEPDELLADPRIGLVSICTHTDTHVALALRALAAGKHVLVEKPVAVRAADVKRLAAAAVKASTLCMPAMCMRFWPGWDWLADRVRDGSLGAVKSAVFARVGAGPGWSHEFYRDISRSGGALADLHIHDADIVYWLFGRAREVVSAGSVDHLTTLYRFRDGPHHVTAEGGWSFTPSAPFRMRFTVCFEHATADWDLMRTPTLLVHGQDGTTAPVLSPLGAYEAEIRHFVAACAGDGELRATMADAVAVAEMLDAERASLAAGAPVQF